jgi:hypothetical protein
MCFASLLFLQMMSKLHLKNKLLERFISAELASYVEPVRKGTPKGDPIGFSRAKYHATLYDLTGKSLKDQADDLGVNYAVLRIWHTEPEFKKLVARHRERFARTVDRRLVIKQLQEETKTLEKFSRMLSEGLLPMLSALAEKKNPSSADEEELRKLEASLLDRTIQQLKDRKGRKQAIEVLSAVKQISQHEHD